jgi:hypothetical protein
MSRAAVSELLDRALLDEGFRRTVEADPEGTLAGFDLSAEERSALLSRDLTKMDEAFPLYCTIRFAMINENIVAMAPFPDDALRAELQRRGGDIVAMAGDRIEPLKELLRLMR